MVVWQRHLGLSVASPFVVQEERPPETRRNKFEEQIRRTGNVKDREPGLVRLRSRRRERLDPPRRVDRPENIFNFITACNMEILRSRLSGVN